MPPPARTLLSIALLAALPAWAEQTLPQINVEAEKDDFDARRSDPDANIQGIVQ